jgi:hypothetical protein
MLAALLPALGGAGLTYALLCYRRFDCWSVAIILAGLCGYYVHFYQTGWTEFTLDPEAHAYYVKSLANRHAIPTSEETSASHHPPTYYLMAAGAYRLALHYHASEALDDARHVSMICFVLFIVMAASLLRLLLPRGPSYYTALIMLVFWPVGMTMGSRLSCDILLYAGEAGVFYALARWFVTRRAEDLGDAFIWCGVSVLGKNSGIFMLGVTGLVLAKAAFDNRAQWREFVTLRLILSVLFAGACTALTVWHGWIGTHMLVSPEDHWMALWHVLWSFNPTLLLFDTDMGLSGGLFWNRVLHSLILGDFLPWRSGDIEIALNIVWAAILVYLATGIGQFRRMQGPFFPIVRVFSLIALMWVASMVAIRVRSGNSAYADSRYIYPVIIVITLFHGLLMERYRACGKEGLYRTGAGLGVTFALLAILLLAARTASFIAIDKPPALTENHATQPSGE